MATHDAVQRMLNTCFVIGQVTIPSFLEDCVKTPVGSSIPLHEDFLPDANDDWDFFEEIQTLIRNVNMMHKDFSLPLDECLVLLFRDDEWRVHHLKCAITPKNPPKKPYEQFIHDCVALPLNSCLPLPEEFHQSVNEIYETTRDYNLMHKEYSLPLNHIFIFALEGMNMNVYHVKI